MAHAALSMQSSAPAVNEGIQFLLNLASVNFGHFEMHKHHLRVGTLRVIGDIPQGVRVKAYDENGSRILNVACGQDQRERVIQSIEGWNRSRIPPREDDREHRALPPQTVPLEERRQFRQRAQEFLSVPIGERVAAALAAERQQKSIALAVAPSTPVSQEPAPMPIAETVTMKEAAALVGRSEAAIRLWGTNGKLKTFTESRKNMHGKPADVIVAKKADVLAIMEGITPRGRTGKAKAGNGQGKKLSTKKPADMPVHFNDGGPRQTATPPAAPPANAKPTAKVLTADDAEWLLLEQAASLVGLSKAAVQDYIHSGDLMMLPGSPVVLVRRIDAELLKKKLTPGNGESGPMAPIVDRLASVIGQLSETMRAMQAELKNNSLELKALREILPGMLEVKTEAAHG